VIDTRPVVCQLVHTLNVGGAEVLAGNLARRLQDRFRFVFLCLDEFGPGADSLREEGFPVEVIGRRSGLDLGCSLRLAARWRHYDVELVQAHQYTPFFYSLLARLRNRRPPIIFTEHGRHFPDYPRMKRKLVNRLLLERRDHVVAVGRSVKQALVENEGIPGRRIEVILNGIDTARFAPDPDSRANVRRELGVGPDDYLVLMVARLDPIKDHRTAISACARAAASISGLKLVLVGDGPERLTIETFVREQRLEKMVKLLGTRSDVPRLLTGADTLLLSSVSEGIPLTVIESLATGVPVVSTDVGSVADVVISGVGLLAPAGDVEALGNHLVQLGRARLLRTAMGDQGRARVIAEFSEEAMSGAYTELFDHALAGRGAPFVVTE
jgi:glycosyltransferase involved in cell wall biosynthesis